MMGLSVVTTIGSPSPFSTSKQEAIHAYIVLLAKKLLKDRLWGLRFRVVPPLNLKIEKPVFRVTMKVVLMWLPGWLG